jgi:hypothetical protein
VTISLLDALKAHTIVVADTGDIESIRQYLGASSTGTSSTAGAATGRPPRTLGSCR